MRFRAIEDQQVARFHFNLNDFIFQSGCIRLKTVPVLWLGQFPCVIIAVKPGNALEATHVFIDLVCQGQNTLYILWSGLGVVIPMDKSLLNMSFAIWEIEVGSVNRHP